MRVKYRVPRESFFWHLSAFNNFATHAETLLLTGMFMIFPWSRRLYLDTEYRLNGAIYVWNVEQLLAQNSAIIVPSFASIMPRIRSIDIDEKIDFKMAEALFS
jgi:hypothetical protein